MRAGSRESPASPQCAGGGVRREFRALPALPARVALTTRRCRGDAGHSLRLRGGCLNGARAFPSCVSRGGKAAPGTHAWTLARPPPCGPGNPHLPQCALGAGRGNRLKLEWGSLRLGLGRERARGLPQVPAPALAVALATGRAGRTAGAAAASGKPGGSAPAWGSAPEAGVSLRAPEGSMRGAVCGEDWRRWAPGKGVSAERGAVG